MVSLNSFEKTSNEYNQIEEKCERCAKLTTNDHWLEDIKKVEKSSKYMSHKHQLLIENFKSILSDLSSDQIYDLIIDFYQIKIKSNQIEKNEQLIGEKVKDLKLNNNAKNNCIHKYINLLKNDLRELKLNIEKINDSKRNLIKEDQLSIDDINVENNSENILINQRRASSNNDDDSLPSLLKEDSNESSPLSSPRISIPESIQLNNHLTKLDSEKSKLNDNDNDNDLDDIDDISLFIDSDLTPRISQKIRLSNNIVRLMRGPLRIMLDGTLHAVEVFAKQANASDAVVQAINKGLNKQKQLEKEDQILPNSLKCPYIQITSDWIFEGENADKGFSSTSIWMRNPQGRRVLVKNQDLALCAANEWLAYVLGRQIALPVNEVQISIYEKNLVTLHMDVTQTNEKIFTFMDLPKKIKKRLLSNPMMQCMDLFDHIIQNVDRNPRNILVTIPNNANIDDPNAKLKIFFIDHSSCFGMGKLNGISVIASKLHTTHLSIVKFDPIEQANKFEKYLAKLPTTDRVLIRKILNRFADINDNQFDFWINQIKDLLSPSQFNRIHRVLYRQRDIVRRYIIKWGIYQPSPSISISNNNDNNITTSTNNQTYTYL